MKTLDQRLSWLGGVVDGEGHVSVTLQPRPNKMRKDGTLGCAMYPDVGVTNTDLAIIKEVEAIAVELGIKSKTYLLTRATRVTKPCWTVRFNGFGRVEAILTALLPYLIGSKREKAEITLRIIAHRRTTMDDRPARGPRSRPEADLWLMKQLGNLKHLNRRGPDPVETR